ncbi:MarR family transcriptional regulator [Nocardiopsis metallicus]|uniref:Uncharacterized protein n=1 Tax=Nocardiopsis metallicus TaxID=179819 RepID=A0A840W4S1_9ACTN|nr:helix-turn-helix domain-containing protein [Nocardiopsis metallicus]MBB5491960.1 hypothetical protein [Nocardiopsis metallicus]
MSAQAPASLLVRPSSGVVMHSLIEANPAVPISYEPDLPELFRRSLRVCRELERAVTVAELAARMGHSPAVVGVVVTELADADLVRVVRAPAWAERLRVWATLTRPVPVAVSVIKTLIVSTRQDHTHSALTRLSGDGPWCLQESPRIEVATTRLAPDLDMLALGISGLGGASPVWWDVCREAFGAVVVSQDSGWELAATRESLLVLREAGVPVVVLVQETDEGEVGTDVVRACLGLSQRVPVVIGDVHGRGACEALMDLCSALMSGGGR